MLAAKILEISMVSCNRRLALSLSLLPESLIKPNQNLLSLADFKACCKKLEKSFLDLPA